MIFHLRALACVGFEWSRDAIHRLTLYSNILHWLTIFSSSYYCWSIILFLEQYSLMQLRLIFSCDEDDNDSSGLLVSNKGKENHFQVQMVSTLYYFCQLLLVSLNPRLKFHSCFLQTIEQQQIIQLIHPTYYWWIPLALLRWWYLVDRSDLVTSNVWAIISTMVSKETPGSIAMVLWIGQGGVRHGGVSRIAALKVSFLFLGTWFSPANKRCW